ncbi:protein kinase domain-containing protein [Corallococcus macrosporus]|uniref:Serine/threonine protein kinase n=1 Tax=Corallococcus macrosporus DSM 14697 TaxID=1189310 RepID=A0A250JRK7_9BACT|nr:protein kinase [Corallococcus macrosporus]ATB46509.1 serine/threonine protein kinase [Corallococcus macrosporus DSM 14697]
MNERYRLVRPLAIGGMAELFLGVARGAEGFERPVAIKRVLPHLAREPDIARMFLAEARLATLLQHQNIATVHDVGQGPEGLFLVMELVDGWDLGVLLRSAASRGVRFPPHLAAFIVHQALAGLGHAYRKVHDGRPVMVAHRDVSPSNILVSREGEVKLTDFGIARMAGPAHTAPGVFRGKEAYTAPEVLKGGPATAASDQFSLGIVLYELLTGRHPFHAEKDASAVAYAILTRPVSPPQDVPAPLAGAVMRMLARTPQERFHSPESLAEGFARWLAQAGEPATSQALAAFLQGLGLPPPLSEQAASPSGLPAPGLRDDAGPRPPGGTPAQSPAPAQAGARAWASQGHERPSPPDMEALGQPPGPTLSMAGGSGPHAVDTRAGTHAPGPMGSALASGSRGASAAPGAEEEEPLSLPGGAALSVSGRLVHRCPRCSHVVSSPQARCSHCAMWPDAPRDEAPVQRPSHAPGAFAPPPGGLELSAQQTLAESVPQSYVTPGAKSVLHTAADELELAERAYAPESDWPDEAALLRRSRRRRAVGLLLVALLVGAGVWLWPRRSTVLIRVMAATGLRLSPTPMLRVDSDPPGATVWVRDAELGTTPLALENRYPEGRVPLQVRLKGHRTWKGTFSGGEAAHIDAKLKR